LVAPLALPDLDFGHATRIGTTTTTCTDAQVYVSLVIGFGRYMASCGGSGERVVTKNQSAVAGWAQRLAIYGVAIGLLGVCAGSAQAQVTPTGLRADTQQDPVGLGDAAPMLSWRLPADRQSAYEVRVSTDAGAQLWDSGKVTSTETS